MKRVKVQHNSSAIISYHPYNSMVRERVLNNCLYQGVLSCLWYDAQELFLKNECEVSCMHFLRIIKYVGALWDHILCHSILWTCNYHFGCLYFRGHQKNWVESAANCLKAEIVQQRNKRKITMEKKYQATPLRKFIYPVSN